MRTVDWIVFFAFLAYVVWDGMRRRTGAKDLEGYYAGSRSIPWWAAGLSIMATQASAITILGTTGQGHEHGMDFVQTYFGLPFAMVLLCIFLVPFYRSRAVLTPYELLEDRFGPVTRTLASLIFLCSRCLALGAVIYAPAVALSAMIGLQTWESVVVIGVLTTGYTVVGGVSAVIWTDVKQMTVILLGLLLVLFFLLRDLLPVFDLGQLLDLAGAAGKLNALEVEPEHLGLWPRTHEAIAAGAGAPSFWEEKYNLWSGLFGGLFLHLSYFGCDHSQAQRLLTSKDTGASRKSLLMSAFAKVPMQAFVLLLGVLMWLFYSVHGQPLLYKTTQVERAASAELAPAVQQIEVRFAAALQTRKECMVELAALPGGPTSEPDVLARYQASVRNVQAIRKEARMLVGGAVDANGKPVDAPDTNDIFCRFILDQMPPILLGLIIAAIFAAAMSSIDSEVSALAATTINDLYRPYLVRDAADGHYVLAARLATLGWGAVAAGFALFAGRLGSVIEAVNAVGSYFYGALLGTFALAYGARRANGDGAVAGLAAGVLAVAVCDARLDVAWLWLNPIGAATTVAVGLAVSRLRPRPAA